MARVQSDGPEQGPLAQAAGEEVPVPDDGAHDVDPGGEVGVGQQLGCPAVQVVNHRALRDRHVLVAQHCGHQIGLAVCAGQVSLAAAQKAIVADWTTALTVLYLG